MAQLSTFVVWPETLLDLGHGLRQTCWTNESLQKDTLGVIFGTIKRCCRDSSYPEHPDGALRLLTNILVDV